MSVSVPAVSNPAPATGTGSSGQRLVLQVVNRTDGVLQTLSSLVSSKPVQLTVLNAAPNGRASVLLGSTQVDVKASLPVKTGDFVVARLEQNGSVLRFVQTGSTQTAQTSARLAPNLPPPASANPALLGATSNPNILIAGRETVAAVVQALVDPKFQGPQKPPQRNDKPSATGDRYSPTLRSYGTALSLKDAIVEGAERKIRGHEATFTQNEETDFLERPKQTSVDVKFPISVAGGDKQADVQLVIWQDQESATDERERENWVVQFSVDAVSTGLVHAQLRYRSGRIQVSLWADDPSLAQQLRARSDFIEERLAATGLRADGLIVRSSEPTNLMEKHSLPPSNRLDKEA